MRLSRRQLGASAFAWMATAGPARAGSGEATALSLSRPLWATLPPTPDLPQPDRDARLSIGGTEIYCAQYGQGHPVLLLHGGMGSSNYWGHQIRHLAGRYRIVAMDTRGHGRSPLTSPDLGYDLFAKDVLGLMRAIDISRVTVVGWSDGAITGITLAMTHPDRVDRLFAFGGNVSRRAMRRCAGECPTFAAYARRCRSEYDRLSPAPDKWPDLMKGLRAMWRGQQDFGKGDLQRIRARTLVADGDHDEIIKPSHAIEVARKIPSARALLLPNLSHFAMLQDPAAFNAALDGFLA